MKSPEASRRETQGELEVRDPAFEVRKHPRGGQIVVVPQQHLHRVHLGLYVRTGSRFETERLSGISHFLEHMLYRGTPSLRHAHDVNFAFERLGGSLYAATQVDYAVYAVSMPPENLDEGAKVFAEVLAKPTFPDVAIEKGIVCEEILEDLDDEGRQVDADNVSRALIYPNHALGYTITGTHDHVKSFTEPMLRAHHGKHYCGENLVVVVSGHVDPAHGLEVGAAVLDAFPAGPRVAAEAPVHAQKKPRLRMVESISSQTELRVCFRAFAETAAERGPLDLMMRTIDDGMSTRLYHRICDAQGLCYDVSGNYDGYEDDGVVDLSAGVMHARASHVAGEILAMLGELATHGPTPDEIDKARARRRWELRAMHDSPEELGSLFALGLLFQRFATPRQYYERIARATRDEVVEVARTLVRPDRLNVVAVGMLEGKEGKRLADLIKNYRVA